MQTEIASCDIAHLDLEMVMTFGVECITLRHRLVKKMTWTLVGVVYLFMMLITNMYLFVTSLA